MKKKSHITESKQSLKSMVTDILTWMPELENCPISVPLMKELQLIHQQISEEVSFIPKRELLSIQFQKSLGELIAVYRKQHHLSQKDLADILFIESNSSISRYETGNSEIKIEYLIRLCMYFGPEFITDLAEILNKIYAMYKED